MTRVVRRSSRSNSSSNNNSNSSNLNSTSTSTAASKVHPYASSGGGHSMRSSTDHSHSHSHSSSSRHSRHLQPRPPSAQNGYKAASASLSPHDSRSRRTLPPSSSESPQLPSHPEHLTSLRSPSIAERLTPQTPESFQSMGSSTDSSYVMSNYSTDMAMRPELRKYNSMGATQSHHRSSTSVSHLGDPSYLHTGDPSLSQQSSTFDTWTRNVLVETPSEAWTSRDNGHGTLLGDWLGATDNGHGLEIPHGLRHIQQLDEPWELLTMPERRPRTEVFETIEEKNDGPSIVSDGFWSVSEYNKAGKRNGPLSSETRQNANDVRSVGSCLRCFVMKEHCDTGYPCSNCNKVSRSWKFSRCIRPRLAQRSNYLLPEALVKRLKRGYVNDWITDRGWRMISGRVIALHLDIGLGGLLDLPVREYLPYQTDNPFRPAFLNEQTADGPRAVEMYEYDLPVLPAVANQDVADGQVVVYIRTQVKRWFDEVMRNLNAGQTKWACHWFPDDFDSFQCDIMSVICQYFRDELLPQHELVRDAFALSFLNYIFIHSFEVPQSEVHGVMSQMERPPNVDFQHLRWVSPSTLNKYIKMLMFPLLRDVAQRIFRNLEPLLLDTGNTSTWRRDVIFASAFVVVAYVGKTQVTLYQLAMQPEPNETTAVPAYTMQDAAKDVQDLETECADMLIDYLKQFLVPSARRKSYGSAPKNKMKKVMIGDTDAEAHAQRSQLLQKVSNIRDEYIDSMPQSFEIDWQNTDISTFAARNTHRVCWKFIQGVLAELK